MIYGKWYIFLYDKTGCEINKKGPYAWNIASQMRASYERDGLRDLDRLTAEQEQARG